MTRKPTPPEHVDYQDGIPIAPAVLVPPTEKRLGPAFSWVIPVCPICGGRHIHGAGIDPDKVDCFLGHRVSHCSPRNQRGYILRKTDDLSSDNPG